MLSKIEQAQEKWGGSHQTIDTWLQSRRELLVHYCKLAGLPPFEREHKALPDHDAIEHFCELLMDYVSAGHFEFYDRIMEESQLNGQGKKLADEVYPLISETTDAALDFNDQYADIEEDQNMQSFDRHLSKLGQAMEQRFELEDRLIQTLYKHHQE
ncbi:sigma D regulator [Aliiglaciecola sp. CAU 1673]|uniref:sigma D regulator n=1 Tax=Aliiglaciecola sp. CAU 1673 TaxID=3032595 RepID=UPI0023DC36FC|nr:sigma D regulator [Aliiglaciecola sp. CAU 1673]MDF2180393.1 sigma D regulator [Aliiglaciecola sp. CAU 1673]